MKKGQKLLNIIGSSFDIDVEDIEPPKCDNNLTPICAPSESKRFATISISLCQEGMAYVCGQAKEGETYSLKNGKDTPVMSISIATSKDGCKVKSFTLDNEAAHRTGTLTIKKLTDKEAEFSFQNVQLIIKDYANGRYNPETGKIEVPILDKATVSGEARTAQVNPGKCQ